MQVIDGFVLLRGGGDLATGVAFRLSKAGLPVVVLELPEPLVVRRRVALATAVLEGDVEVEGLHARRVSTLARAQALLAREIIPVLVSPDLPDWQLSPGGSQLPVTNNQPPTTDPQPPSNTLSPPASIIVDARMTKRNVDTTKDQARLVIALGPGFSAGVDCHAVIETMRGHRLGRVIWQGSAQPNTRTPGIVAGKGAERVLRAPAAGKVSWHVDIGDMVKEEQLLGHVESEPLRAPFDGVMRGLIAPGTVVSSGLKIGDLDARGDRSACFTISDKALAIGGGVLEAILTWRRQEG